jgi:glutathione S-transferase
MLVGTCRKAANVPYPNTYATHAEAEASPEKYRFNCAQRAHSNLLENIPNFVISAAIAGLKYPKVVGGLGGVWVLGRFLYARGYVYSSKKEGRGRYNGIFYAIAQLGLMGLAAWTGYSMVMGQ